MTHTFRVNTPADLARMIAYSHQIGVSHYTILLRALAAGRIGLYVPGRDTSGTAIKPYLAALKRRSVVLVGDDDDFPAGPGGWRQAARLLDWASFVIVHGAAARDGDYHQAVALAEAGHRLLLVECTSSHAPAWMAAAGASPSHPPCVVIIPPPGTGPHPVADRSERLQ